MLPAPERLQVARAHREAGPADSISAGLLRAVDLEPSLGLRHDSCNYVIHNPMGDHEPSWGLRQRHGNTRLCIGGEKKSAHICYRGRMCFGRDATPWFGRRLTDRRLHHFASFFVLK